MGPEYVIFCCLREDEMYNVLHACHDEPHGGNFISKRVALKVVHVGYYWKILHNNAKKYVSKCDERQRIGRLTQDDEMPLTPLVSFEPFNKWGLEFFRPINPPSNQKNYILVCTYYLTKWVEVMSLPNSKEDKVVYFLYGKIFTRFGVSIEIVIYQGS
jgi:hypothetical protein